MMNFIEQHRTRLSQVFGTLFVVFLMISNSQWKTAYPAVSGLMFLTGIVLIGCAVIGRIWCAQYIAGYKNDILVREGPYSMTRNPLYFFSFLGCIGFGLCTESLVITAILVAIFLPVYYNVIRIEEKKLTRYFGDEYAKYIAQVPRFFPDFSLYHEVQTYEVKPKVFRHACRDVIWFIWSVGLLEVIEGLQAINVLPMLISIY